MVSRKYDTGKSSKKTVSFRIRGDSEASPASDSDNNPNSNNTKKQPHPSYSSKRSIGYNDIMDRYDISGNTDIKDNRERQNTSSNSNTKRSSDKNVVDNIYKVKNDDNNNNNARRSSRNNNKGNKEEDDSSAKDSEYSNYNNSKASHSHSSPHTYAYASKRPPPPQMASNLLGLEETIDSLDEDEVGYSRRSTNTTTREQAQRSQQAPVPAPQKQPQQQAPLLFTERLVHLRKMSQNDHKNTHEYNMYGEGNAYGMSSNSVSEIEAEISQNQQFTAERPQHNRPPMEESIRSESNGESFFISSEAEEDVHGILNESESERLELELENIPKTKSFVTRLTDDVLSRQKMSMTQSEYQIQTQLSILGKLAHNLRVKNQNQHVDDLDDGRGITPPAAQTAATGSRYNEYNDDDDSDPNKYYDAQEDQQEQEEQTPTKKGFFAFLPFFGRNKQLQPSQEEDYSEEEEEDDDNPMHTDEYAYAMGQQQQQEEEEASKKRRFGCPNPFAKRQTVTDDEDDHSSDDPMVQSNEPGDVEYAHAIGQQEQLEEGEEPPEKKRFGCPNPFAKKQPVIEVERKYSSDNSIIQSNAPGVDEYGHAMGQQQLEEGEEPPKKRFGCPNPFAKKQPVIEEEDNYSSSSGDDDDDNSSSQYSDDDEEYANPKISSSSQNSLDESEDNDRIVSNEKQGNLLAGLSTNQPKNTRLICFVILLFLFIVFIISVVVIPPTLQSNAQEQAIEEMRQQIMKEKKQQQQQAAAGKNNTFVPTASPQKDTGGDDPTDTGGATGPTASGIKDSASVKPTIIQNSFIQPIKDSASVKPTIIQDSSIQPNIKSPTFTPSKSPITFIDIASPTLITAPTPTINPTSLTPTTPPTVKPTSVTPTAIVSKEVIIKQRYYLATFYNATQNTMGNNDMVARASTWTNCGYDENVETCIVNSQTYYRWLSNVNQCKWYGITCDEEGFVTAIIMDSNNLGGSLPIQIFDILSLKRISLRYNSIGKQLPQQNNNNNNNSQLRTLLLNNNLFTGTIPTSLLGNMNNLLSLSLGSNQFNGTITSALFPKSLVNINIKGNLLSGSIPEEFLLDADRAMTLEYMDIGSNQFTGTISSLWGSSSMILLRVLTMYNNYFTGTLPSDILLSSSLKELSVGMNELTGTIPSSSTTTTKSYLQYLNLGANEFTGSIPQNLGDMTSLQTLVLWQNSLTGILPSTLGNLVSLNMLQVPYNNIRGTMPDSICNLRDRNLTILSSDCRSSDGGEMVAPKVTCSCCTTCYYGY